MGKVLRSCLFAALLAAPGFAQMRVDVCLSGLTPQIDAAALMRAQSQAASILASENISLNWVRGKTCATQTQKIVLEVLRFAPDSASRTALASTRNNRVSVFWDRVARVSSGHPVGSILGHVMAHEIVHALPGSPRHEDEGLMKAVWNRQDLRAMRGGD